LANTQIGSHFGLQILMSSKTTQ